MQNNHVDSRVRSDLRCPKIAFEMVSDKAYARKRIQMLEPSNFSVKSSLRCVQTVDQDDLRNISWLGSKITICVSVCKRSFSGRFFTTCDFRPEHNNRATNLKLRELN